MSFEGPETTVRAAWWRRAWRVSKILFALVMSLLVMGALAAVGYVARELQQAGVSVSSVPALTDPSKAPLPQPVAYRDADGELLGRRGTEQRVILSPQDIPPVMKQAIVAIEDQRFYQHRGVDFQGLLRAAITDLKTRSAAQGASTITMQYVRNVYLNFEKTAHRKFQELALSLQLETRWTKQRLLTAYLNTVFFGEGAYGIEAAARRYFGVPAKDLKLHQAALLAGLVQSPSRLNPRAHVRAARARQAVVIDEMFAQGMITREQATRAKARTWKLRKLARSETTHEPALVAMLERETRSRLPARTFRRGGFTVRASFSMRKIRQARKLLAGAYPQLPAARRPVVAASFVQANTGRILLLAHSRSARSQFDYAAQSRRQPGSTVKAFTAARYLQEGGQLADPLDDSPLEVKRSDGTSYTVKPTTSASKNVFDMLRFSQNPAAWRLFQKVGGKDVLALERRLGLDGMDSNPAAALGGVRTGTSPLGLAGAFGVFASDGKTKSSHAVTEIKDLLGNPIWDDRALSAARKFPAEYSRQLTVGLRKVINAGFPQLKANLPVSRTRPLAGKTGTSENNADAWFAGYTPQLAGAVWTGYATSRKSLANLPGGAVWGSTVPAQSFDRLLRDLLDGQPVVKFPKPQGVQRIPALDGLSLPDAQAKLARFRFTSVQATSVFSADHRPGRVLSQQPAAGVWMTPGSPVQITYATDQRPTPDLVGLPFTDAERRLRTFAKVTVRFKVSEKPLGTVLEQTPYAGAPLRYRDELALTVATQPGPVRIRVKKVKYVPSDSELAELRAQLKAAEDRAGQTQTQLLLPDLTGLDEAAAGQVLRSLGLQVQLSGQGTTVIGQDPPAGQTLTAGQAVTVTLG